MEKKKFVFTFCFLSAILVLLNLPANSQAQCTSDADCNDGVYYNGMETCYLVTGTCLPGVTPVKKDLIAGGGGKAKSAIDVGDVLVWNDAENLYVRYIVDDPWCLTETHLHVATSLALIPQKNNNPVPGQFEFMHPLSCVQQDQFVIPLASFDGTELFIAAHAVVAREIMFGIFQYKTAWGAGSRFSNKNWATYFIYTVQEIVIPGSIGDFVWNDSNGNGIQDAGEPGVPGVTVKLRDCASVVLATTITDANGLYQFSNLLPDDYLIEFVAPAGYAFTVASAPGSTPVNDSNADSNGKTLCTTLSSGENNNTLDAGLIQPA